MSQALERRCAACGAPLAERQRWCLRCGASALTRIAAPRRWAGTLALAALVSVLALIGIGYAVAALVSA